MHFTAEQYCNDVINGRISVCQWVRLACERHRRDLIDGHQRGLCFDERAAKMVIAFFSVIKHSKGEWAGRPVQLEPWQQFILWVLFGWKRADGTRRFKTAYIEVPRKNGKTLLAAGLGCFLTVADGEGGAEVYSAATTRDQARLSHGDAVRMVRQSPELGRELKLYKDNIHSTRTFSKFEPLSSDYNSLDGLNVHGAIADELHAWKGRDLWDILETATGSRRQPLMLAITTAGSDRQSLCYQWHDYVEKVLAGILEDDSVFGVIYTIDEGDDWGDESTWFKANPNLGISKKLENMRDLAARAREMPSQLNAFLTKHLNVWVSGETRWMNPDKWRACNTAVSIEQLRGRKCYGGLDLSTTTDVSALIWVFEPLPNKDVYPVLCRFFIPGENIPERVRRDRVPFDAWVRAGYVTATPGNVIDYEWILSQIEQDAAIFEVRELAFDRWGSQQIMNQLQDRLGFLVDADEAHRLKRPLLVQFGQGFASMSSPMKELEKLVISRRLAHGGNPVLSWMADNVVAVQDPAGNIKPDKSKSREKIDGIVGVIMGLDRAIRHERKSSVYATRGIRTI